MLCSITVFDDLTIILADESDGLRLIVEGGVKKSTIINQVQAGAMLAQLLGEKEEGGVAKELYAIAEPVFADWPIECRPIP